MAKDLLYTGGVIAAVEKYLLNDKIGKLCEVTAEEALRTLSESGFGKGVEVSSVYEYEKLVSADEADIDAFIREYSPSKAEAEYLLSPRDFHNAKALLKAYYLKTDVEKMLAPEGLIPVNEIYGCIKQENYESLGDIGIALKQASALFGEDKQASGAEIGNIFEKAQYAHLSRAFRKNRLLKKLLSAKADMTNILSAFRSPDAETAVKYYVEGGTLSEKQLSALFNEDIEQAENCLNSTPYAEFVKKCFADKKAGLPLTAAERLSESYEGEFFTAKKYELQKNQPFLYYVFRRRTENSNVRILMACLLAGMNENDIKRRLRTV